MNEDNNWENYLKNVKKLNFNVNKFSLKSTAIIFKKDFQDFSTYSEEIMLISDKKIKKQQNKIDSKIDLHGMTIAEAKKAIIDFLFIAKARNYSTILIVTGKGEYLNHQYQGKLKNSIKELLAGCGAIIKNYRQAPKHLGGEGAFIVTLRD